ncbi:MAG: FKBP-type peptidyl-prolyl cis-trans isomerase [Cytophagales bacterium]
MIHFKPSFIFFVLLIHLTNLVYAQQIHHFDTLKTNSGLVIVLKDKCQNVESKPKIGEKIKVHYTGTFENGQKFESSYDFGNPFKFELGKKEVIPAWDEAFLYLCENQKATLLVPSSLAYGEKGLLDPIDKSKFLIPPSSTLFYEVVLVKVIRKKK